MPTSSELNCWKFYWITKRYSTPTPRRRQWRCQVKLFWSRWELKLSKSKRSFAANNFACHTHTQHEVVWAGAVPESMESMRLRLWLTALQLRAKLMTSLENNNNKVQLTAYAVSVKVRVVNRCRCQCAYARVHAFARRVLGTRLKKNKKKKTSCICERQKPQDQRRPSPKTSGTTIGHATPAATCHTNAATCHWPSYSLGVRSCLASEAVQMQWQRSSCQSYSQSRSSHH